MRYPLMALFFAILVGCTPTPSNQTTKATVPVIVTPAYSANQPVIENKDYKNWKQFPIGTMVVHRTVAKRAKNETISTEILRLVKVTDEEVELERQNTTERNDGSLKVVNPAEPRRFRKSFGLPDGMKAEDFAKPSLKAELVGEESVTVLGKAYKAKHYKWSDASEAGPMKIDLWESDEFPGRTLKQLIVVDKLETTTTLEILELKIPEQK